jgi:hypothetical protein
MTAAADLLSAVRGRRLCFELARRADDGTMHHAVHAAGMRVDTDRGLMGRSVAVLVAETPGDDPRAVGARRPDPEVAPSLAAIDPAVATRPEHLLPALADTVRSAMYWQPPYAEDVVLADPAVAALLLPVAEAVLRAPGAGWWADPFDRTGQVLTRMLPEPEPPPRRFLRRRRDRGPEPRTAAERLDRWREAAVAQEEQFAEHARRQPGVRLGGSWWVTPAVVGLPLTSRLLGPDGSAALWLTEDELGWTSADLTRVVVDPAARVLEITGPEDWAALVAAHPLDVTASRRPDWFTALDARPGRWLAPDWASVAEAYDGVHVGVTGWLTTAGRPVPVEAGATTTLAGWDPDATWWLTDRAPVPAPDACPVRWVRDRDDGTWSPAGLEA